MTRLQGLQDYKSKDSKGYNRFQRDMDPLPNEGSGIIRCRKPGILAKIRGGWMDS